MDFHTRIECEAFPVKCILNCGNLIQRKYLIDHLKEDCSLR